MHRASSIRRLAWSFAVLVVIAAPGATVRAQGNLNDPTQSVGRLVPPSGAMPLIRIPSADQRAVRNTAEQLWAIVLRNPAVNPPIGFNLKPDMVAHGYDRPGAPRALPYDWYAAGLLYWYIFRADINRVEALPVSDHAFFISANSLPVVFSSEWHSDANGQMYFEPRELRRVGGYPQYTNGVVVVTNTGRSVWRPVPRERLLRWELDTERTRVESASRTARETASYDPQAILDAWLRDRPARLRANDETYETLKKSDPKAAEQFRANAATAEAGTEQSFREMIVRHTHDGPLLQQQVDRRRQDTETCVRYLEEELKRLSPAERTAPGYVSAQGHKAPTPSCSFVVDADAPGADRIVEPDWAFFDPHLPRTAVQVIMIDFRNFEPPFNSASKQRVYERLRDGMDYQAFASMLARR